MTDTASPPETKRNAGRPPRVKSPPEPMATIIDQASIEAALMRQVDALIDVKKVSLLTTLSPNEINRRVSEERFPRPIRIGEMRKAWKLSVIENWLQNPTY